MEAFQLDSKFFDRLLRIKYVRETMDYVFRETKEVLGEGQPDAE